MRTIFLHSIFTFLFISIYFNLTSQTVSAPSPNVAAVNYGKYADIQPNLYNGALQVPISLASLTHGTVSTGVSVGYHSSGFRANELASEVGLGWHLQAGGAITRQIRGLDDFGTFGWLKTGDQIQGNITQSLINMIRNEKVDPEPDLFTFQVNGMSGKFYFDTNGSIHTVPESDIRIEWNTDETYFDFNTMQNAVYQYFLITDMSGTKYYFGQNRDTKVYEIEYTTFNDRKSSAWFLNRIESHDSYHYIDFSYQDEYYQYYSVNDCGYAWQGINSSCQMSITKVKVETKLIKTIASETCNVVFEYINRTDLPINDNFSSHTPQRLFRLFINEGEHSKKVVFQNSGYFIGNSEFPTELVGDDIEDDDKDELNKHLRLVGIDISGVGTETLSYDFTYYGIGGNSSGQFFSNSATLAQDHWGYYNGAVGNNSKDNIIPLTFVDTGGSIVTGGSSNVERGTSFTHMIAGALEKMTLPTGGEIIYTYESNTFGNSNTSCGGLRVNEISSNDQHGNTIVRTYNYGTGQIYKLPRYGGTNTTDAFFNSRGFYGLSSFDGFHVGYEDVEIDYNGNGTKKIEFWTDESPVADNIYPPAVEEIRQFAGSIKSEAILNENVDTLQYSSTILDDSYTSISGDQMLSVEFYPNGSGGFANPNRIYQIHTKHFRLSETKHKKDGVGSSKDYIYFTATKNDPSDIITYNSDGDQISYEFSKWTNFYSGQNLLAAKNYFASNNILIPWSKSISFNNNGTAQETKTHFKNFGIVGDVFYPFESETAYFGIPGSGNSTIIDTTHFVDYTSGLLTTMVPPGSQVLHTYVYYQNLTLKQSCVDNLCSNYVYQGATNNTSNSSRILKQKFEVDATSTSYTYDNLFRLTASVNCADSLTTYEYNISQSDPYLKRVKTLGNDQTGLSNYASETTFQYFDGLGRTIQTVGQQQTFDGKDQISAIEYDDQGRVEFQYETFESSNTNGSYVSNISSIPRTRHFYEPSPLNRIDSLTPPGWNNVAIQSNAYENNSTTLTSIDGDSYTAGTLFKHTVTDGNGHKSISFSDVRGRIIQQQRTDGSNNNITKYAYDDKNRVTQVVPPGSTINNPTLNFFYVYDAENRIVSKIVPSKGEIEYKYDERDLVIAQQDNNLRTRQTNKWYAFEYDEFGREELSGFGNSGGDVNETLTITSYHTSGTGKGKIKDSNVRMLNSSAWIFSTNFYDNCGRVDKVASNNFVSGGLTKYDTTQVSYDGASITTKTREKIRAGSSIGDERFIMFSSEIDDDGRMTGAFVDLDTESSKQISSYEYTVKNQILTKYQGGNNTNFLQQCDYSYLDNKLLSTVNGASSSGTDLYGYRLNYWQTTGVNGQTNQDLQPRYNGNISSIKWAEEGQANQYHNYQYDYLDRLKYHYTQGDLFNSQYTYDDRGNLDSLKRYEEGVIIDDLDYSYFSFNNNQVSHINDLEDKSLGYQDKNNTPYEYDENGNLKRDYQKGITIEYNHLDLAETIEWDNGKLIVFSYDASGKLWRKELFNGTTSLQKHDYIGSFEYINDRIYSIMHSEGRILNEGFENNLCYLFLDHQQSTNGFFDAKRIESIGNIITNFSDYEGSECVEMSQGFEVKPGAEFLAHIGPFNTITESWRYDYEIRDHLGNLKILYTGPNQNNLTVLQRQDYHPYGMSYKKNLNTTLEDKYQFNGIDYVGDFGLDWSMAVYRNLDASIGNWGAVDPFSESFYSMSPYSAMGSNPISYTDQNGGFIHIAIGAAIGGVGNLGYQLFSGNLSSIGDGFAAFGIGALAGGVGAATGGASLAAMGTATSLGGAIGAGVVSGGIGGASAGFLQNTGNALYFQNSNLGDALASGLSGAAWGVVGGMVIGGAIGGIGYKPNFISSGTNTAVTVSDEVYTVTNAQGVDFKVSPAIPNAVQPAGGLDIAGARASGLYTGPVASSRTLTPYYPANGGAIGAWSQTTLKVGQIISRFGSSYGKYFSPSGTSSAARALPPGNNGTLTTYEVLKPITVQQSRIAPAFGKAGGGIQYYSDYLNASELVKGGYLRVIN